MMTAIFATSVPASVVEVLPEGILYAAVGCGLLLGLRLMFRR